MSITFRCPSCQAVLAMAADCAGLKTVRPTCGQRLLVPSPQPAAANKTVLEEIEGAAPASAVREVDEIMIPARTPTNEICYDCGRRLFDGEIVRRDVKVGNPWTHYHWDRVSLCASCKAIRDGRWEPFMIISVGLLCSLVFMVILCSGLSGRH